MRDERQKSPKRRSSARRWPRPTISRYSQRVDHARHQDLIALQRNFFQGSDIHERGADRRRDDTKPQRLLATRQAGFLRAARRYRGVTPNCPNRCGGEPDTSLRYEVCSLNQSRLHTDVADWSVHDPKRSLPHRKIGDCRTRLSGQITLPIRKPVPWSYPWAPVLRRR
jgi:hypothetical protein